VSRLRELKKIPRKPTSRAELRQLLLAISYVKQPRSLRQECRQDIAFFLHVVSNMSVREIARKLGVSKNTITSDLYHEGLRRADELAGTFVPYASRKPERVVHTADLRLLPKVWAAADQRKIDALVAALGEDENHDKLGQRARVREGGTA